MKKFGLIGFPLSHSFSKKYFTDKFEKEGLHDCLYNLYEIPDISDLNQVLVSNPELVGLNVTIPYKLQVIPFMDELDPACEAIGAVNTIKISKGKLFGYNTDYYGFKSSLETWLGDARPRALVLGTGGASKAVVQALIDLNIAYLRVSRTKVNQEDPLLITYEDLHSNSALLQAYTLIINTTPLGTYPNTERTPDIPIAQIDSRHLVYDLVYNPENTAIMIAMAEKGAKVKNGLEMLHLQAEASWDIWNR
ncbi:MAG: shikimate dehydrogenase [Lunatimonas sp.]|uniref:shikimate dehydrogenase family protein n=1 Tax=Lunatimonas sp. TaxID=2060141 RepID=UPI00263B9E1C|nr:shikimate dehydrogenase [Lunatimonas sp.]MCC5935671.1 shikimate dehydrogenase [Lunatimonas sp.]